MRIAIIGPIFVKVTQAGIQYTSSPLELAKKLAANNEVLFISSVGNTSVSNLIKGKIENCNIDVSYVRKSNQGIGFWVESDTTEDIIQYPCLNKCVEDVKWRSDEIFSRIDAFILGSEDYELLGLCKEHNVTPYIYLPEDFLEYLDDDDEEYAEDVVRLTDDNIGEYFEV